MRIRGKSLMSQYLLRRRRGIIFNNFDYRDNFYLFQEFHNIAFFDIPRDSELSFMSWPSKQYKVLFFSFHLGFYSGNFLRIVIS